MSAYKNGIPIASQFAGNCGGAPVLVDDATGDVWCLFADETVYKWQPSKAANVTVTWGGIGGSLSDQADLQTALKAKATSSTTLAGYGIADAVNINDPRLADARPASDVSAWAKASTKPSYTAAEVGADALGTAAAAQTASLPLHGKADTAGAADTAGKLAATKTINGIAFDGSANISVPIANRRKGIPIVTGTAAATLSAANLVAGAIFQLTGTTARIFTLDTGTNISTAFTTAFGAPDVGDVFEFMVANAATAAITVAGATGAVMANVTTVATLQSRTFRVRNTGSNAWTIY